METAVRVGSLDLDLVMSVADSEWNGQQAINGSGTDPRCRGTLTGFVALQ